MCPVNNLRVLFHKLRGVNIGKKIFIGLKCTLDHVYQEYIYMMKLFYQELSIVIAT
jgi:hypothetical protein